MSSPSYKWEAMVEDLTVERDRLRKALLKCREEFCWHANTGKRLGKESYGELVDMVDLALDGERASLNEKTE